MSNRAERALTAAINLLLFPGRVKPTWLSSIATVSMIVGLVLPIILALPPIKGHLFCTSPSFRSVTVEEREIIKNWCDFVVLFCQVLLALMVGGIIITDRIAGAWRARAERLQTELEQVTEAIRTGGASTPIEKELAGYMQQLETLKRGVTWFNLPTRLFKASSIADDVYRGAIPNIFVMFPVQVPRTAILLSMRMASSFPGGYYGMNIFILFVIMIASGALKTYFEYPPVC
jgi:hypothetical protein